MALQCESERPRNHIARSTKLRKRDRQPKLLAAEAAVGGNRTKLGGTRQAGRNVAADSIDILVDLKGYTKTWYPGADVRCRLSSVGSAIRGRCACRSPTTSRVIPS